MIENSIRLKRIIHMALEEDLGTGDVTTEAIFDPKTLGKAFLVGREPLVLAGLPVFKRVFLEISPKFEFEDYYNEGDLTPAGKRICMIKGPIWAILTGERTALNFLQRMSGIATLTRTYIKKAGNPKVRILDTRKTTPGHRELEKYAVRTGGGHNHRSGLFDGILIKDNHIAAAGSIKKAVELARGNSAHTLKVEVEVEDLDGVKEALTAGADIILLDNMQPRLIKKAVQLINGRATIEASGGVNLDTVKEIASTGVDLISVGALTHSAKAADFSLEM